MSSNVILIPVLQLVAFFYFCKVRITQWRKKDFTDHGMPQASRSNPTIGGFSVQANRASCALVGQKVFCPTKTNLPALAGDFSPKSKNPIKGGPDVNLENRTKRLLMVAFFPKRRNWSYGRGTYKTVFCTGGKKRLSIFVPFKGWRIWWIWHTNTIKKVWNCNKQI